MNKLIQLPLYFCCILFTLSVAHARQYSLTVFAEPGAEIRAQEFIDEFKQLEPFKQLVLKGIVSISQSPELALNTSCRGGNLGIERLASCKLSSLTCKSDLCPLFTSVPNIGAGGKPFPISSSSFPWTTMLHEMVHTFGFSDEYAYTTSETRTYCGGETRNANEHSQSKVTTYSTEAKAITACMNAISWCSQAFESGSQVVTRLPDGRYKIGSPKPAGCPNDKLGVYLGAGCEKKNPESTWRPYFCPTVMGYPNIGQDHCEVQERHAIIGRMPNLLPPYYQRVLFQKIMSATGRSDASFESSPAENPLDFSYGIPEVDNLPEGNREQGSKCSRF